MNEFPESQDRDHPDDQPPDCAPETLAVIETAWEALEADEVELAIQRFQEARDLEPDNPAIDVEMGDALFDMGRLDEVIQLMRAVLTVAPATPRANRLLAMALHDRGAHSEALPLFESEVERNPKDPHIHVSLGDAMAALTRRTEAIVCYRHALSLDPALWSAHHGWGHCLALDENFAAAIDHFRAALAIEDNAPEVWLAWGEMLITLRDWAGARDKLLRAVEVDEEYAEAWESLSYVCDHLDDREEALATLRCAIFWNSDREEMIDYLATRYHPHLDFARSWEIVLSGHYVYPDAVPPARTRSHQFRRSYQVWAPDEKTALAYIEEIEGAMWTFCHSVEEIVPGAVAHSCHGGVVVFSDRLYESTLLG